jgi:hypothetical protein
LHASSKRNSVVNPFLGSFNLQPEGVGGCNLIFLMFVTLNVR